MKKRNKHQIGILELEARLKEKGNSSEILLNLEYSLGEFDLLVYSKGSYGYYIEYKSTDRHKSLRTAIKQLVRGTTYLKMIEHTRNWYGIYSTPNGHKIICKNGEVRNEYK